MKRWEAEIRVKENTREGDRKESQPVFFSCALINLDCLSFSGTVYVQSFLSALSLSEKIS